MSNKNKSYLGPSKQSMECQECGWVSNARSEPEQPLFIRTYADAMAFPGYRYAMQNVTVNADLFRDLVKILKDASHNRDRFEDALKAVKRSYGSTAINNGQSTLGLFIDLVLQRTSEQNSNPA